MQNVLNHVSDRPISLANADAAFGPWQLLKKGKGSPHSITERRVPELIPVLGSQPAGDVSHKPGYYFPPGLPLPPQTLRGLLPFSLVGGQRHNWCEQLA